MKQQPGWKAVYDKLPPNDKVAFAEVNCRESRELMQKHQAGQGGWPTLKYFNKDTGLAGAKYQQQTDKRVCDEMKDPVMVAQWVKDIGGVESKILATGEL